MSETKDKSTQKYKMTQDTLFKQCMADKAFASEILETYLLPKDVLSAIELPTLKLEKSDFADKTLGRGISDVLYSVKWNNKKGYISVLIEHQSTSDKLMTFRIKKYMLKIIDLHLIHNKGEELPIIYPVILYTGSKPYTAPRSFYDLFPDPKLAKRFFTNPVHVLSLRDIEDLDLRNKYHTGVVLSLMKKIHKKDILPHLEFLLPFIQLVASKNLHMAEIMLLFVLDNAKSKNDEGIIQLFIDSVPNEYKGKIMRIGERLVEKGRQEGILLGMEEGRQEGRQEGMEKERKSIIGNMLASNMTITNISKITKLSSEEIKKLQRKIH